MSCACDQKRLKMTGPFQRLLHLRNLYGFNSFVLIIGNFKRH